MNDDYKFFVERMGSFEEVVDLDDDNLKHYGILGMRWGHHTGRMVNTKTINATAKAGKAAADMGKAYTKSSSNKKTMKYAKDMTDDELKERTNRLELENRFINAQSNQNGKSRVENILGTVGATMAFVSSAAIMVDTINKARGH